MSEQSPDAIEAKLPSPRARAGQAYWDATREPLSCLVLLLPLVGVYEVGALLLRPAGWPAHGLVAESFIQQLGAWFGADGVWVPGVALVLTLLVWQVWSRNPWRIRGSVPLLMIVECLVLALPLLVLAELFAGQAGGQGGDGLRVQIIRMLGAAVYEELVFRFYLVSGLILLLTRAVRLHEREAKLAAIAVAALVFAACHIEPIGSEALDWPKFVMRTLAGGYLAIVFVVRGLGVSTGCHAVFNLVWVVVIAS